MARPKKESSVMEDLDEREQCEMEQLRAELDAVKGERDSLLEVVQSNRESAENAPQDPMYRLMTVYVPFNAPNITKKNGYDEKSGESFAYTPIQICHKPEGNEHHIFETFNIRLDAKSIVPAFVAEVLGDRCDAQEYNPALDGEIEE